MDAPLLMQERGTVEAERDTAEAERGIALSWDNVNLEVTAKAGFAPWMTRKLPILTGVSGVVRPGQLLAILGPSGSGKTSLLNTLADRVEGRVTGTIALNGIQRTPSLAKKFMGYVMQDDSLLPLLTVYETLMYAARLRLPRSTSTAERRRRVNDVISELGLRPCQNTKIGNESVRGISGGQRRRVSIGIQLIVNPSILLLDEPTSGLDSTTAHHLMETLSKLAAKGRTIITCIHQPRSDIFAMLDLVQILSAGRTVYFGHASEVVPWFTRQGFPCPQFSNPADYILDITSVDTRTTSMESETQDRLTTFIDNYESSSIAQGVRKDIEELESDSKQDLVASNKLLKSLHTGKRLFAIQQMWILICRSFLSQARNWWELLSRLLAYAVMGLTMGLVFYKITHDSLGVRDAFGLSFFVVTLLPFVVILSAISKVDQERASYYREHRDNMYGPFASFAAKIISELPFTILASLIYVCGYYFLAHIWVSWERFLWYNLIILLTIEASMSLAVALGNLLTNFQTSVFVANLVYTLSFLSCGFIVAVNSIPIWFKWIRYVSWVRFSYVGLAVTQFKGRDLEIAPGVFLTQDQLYNMNGIDDVDPWYCAVKILIVIIVLRLVALSALYVVDQKPLH